MSEINTSVPADNWRCAWLANGQQCGYPGVVTESTLGAEKWYCRWHFKKPDQAEGARLVRESQDYIPPKPEKTPHLGHFNSDDDDVLAARARCMETVKGLGSTFGAASNAWAHKILKRHEDGEIMPEDSLRMARNAIIR